MDKFIVNSTNTEAVRKEDVDRIYIRAESDPPLRYTVIIGRGMVGVDFETYELLPDAVAKFEELVAALD